MKHSALLLCFILCGTLACQPRSFNANAESATENPLQDSLQAVVVTNATWADVKASLSLYERLTTTEKWKNTFGPMAAVVGHNGMAWGRGINTIPASGKDFVKVEGDGRSPAGIFRLNKIFGYASSKPTGALFPYLPLAADTECVDDAASEHYNTIVRRSEVSRIDWQSSEKMRAVDLYKWGLTIDHNTNSPVKGGGSCIFMHIWRSSESGTSGCTALAEENLLRVLTWIDPQKNPVLIQMSEAAYKKFSQTWSLP